MHRVPGVQESLALVVNPAVEAILHERPAEQAREKTGGEKRDVTAEDGDIPEEQEGDCQGVREKTYPIAEDEVVSHEIEPAPDVMTEGFRGKLQ